MRLHVDPLEILDKVFSELFSDNYRQQVTIKHFEYIESKRKEHNQIKINSDLSNLV